jgi:hypothetical protein
LAGAFRAADLAAGVADVFAGVFFGFSALAIQFNSSMRKISTRNLNLQIFFTQ